MRAFKALKSVTSLTGLSMVVETILQVKALKFCALTDLLDSAFSRKSLRIN